MDSTLATIIILAIIIGVLGQIISFAAINKYFPEMTFTEYMILEDKIRITPKGE